MGLFLFTLLTLLSISYECTIDPPDNCPSLSTRILNPPSLPKMKLYFENRTPPNDTIGGIPLITFPTKFIVRVTLLNSTSYNRNQLGFFTLPPNVPLPKNPESLNFTLIFSDTKRPCTESGDALNFEFSGGTQVGFYLITDGWCGGISKQWSVPQYNDGLKPMTAVFFDPTINTLVIGMEDTPTQKHFDYHGIVFEVETQPLLNLTWFEGSIAIACSTPCQDCNFTTGKCGSENPTILPRLRNNSYIRRSVLLGILIILGLLLVVAIVFIGYFVYQKTKFNQLIDGGWLPVTTRAFVDEEDFSEEVVKDDLEERLKDDDL